MKAGPALFVGFVLLGLVRSFPVAILTIVGILAATALLVSGAFALARLLDRRYDARATLLAHCEQQHAWVMAGDELGVPEVTTHSFRKTVATLIDDEGLSARIGADQLGHTRISMTQDRYMSRGRVHTQVAELLDRAINDE